MYAHKSCFSLTAVGVNVSVLLGDSRLVPVFSLLHHGGVRRFKGGLHPHQPLGVFSHGLDRFICSLPLRFLLGSLVGLCLFLFGLRGLLLHDFADSLLSVGFHFGLGKLLRVGNVDPFLFSGFPVRHRHGSRRVVFVLARGYLEVRSLRRFRFCESPRRSRFSRNSNFVVLGKLSQDHFRPTAQIIHGRVVGLFPIRSGCSRFVPQPVREALLHVLALFRCVYDVSQHIRCGNIRREKLLAVFLGKLHIPHIRRRVSPVIGKRDPCRPCPLAQLPRLVFAEIAPHILSEICASSSI